MVQQINVTGVFNVYPRLYGYIFSDNRFVACARGRVKLIPIDWCDYMHEASRAHGRMPKAR